MTPSGRVVAAVVVLAVILAACGSRGTTPRSQVQSVPSAGAPGSIPSANGNGAPGRTYGDVAFDGKAGWVDGTDCGTGTCNAFVLRTTDGGQSWSQVTLPSMTPGPISWVDSSEAWLSGTAPYACTNAGTSLCRPVLLQTTDGGQTWIQVYQGAPSGVLSQVSFVSATEGYAVGTGAACDPTVSNCNALLRTTDAGHTWTTVAGAPYPDALDFLDSSRGWVIGQMCGKTCGEVGIYATTDGGQTWSLQLATAMTQAPFASDLSMLDPSVGWAMITNNSNGQCAEAGCWGTLYRTAGGGKWSTVAPQGQWSTPGDPSPGSGFPVQLAFASATDGWVAVSSGASPVPGGIAHSGDGGQSWTVYRPPHIDWSATAIAAVSATEAWVVGTIAPYGDLLAHSTDAGQTWQTVSPVLVSPPSS